MTWLRPSDINPNYNMHPTKTMWKLLFTMHPNIRSMRIDDAVLIISQWLDELPKADLVALKAEPLPRIFFTDRKELEAAVQCLLSKKGIDDSDVRWLDQGAGIAGSTQRDMVPIPSTEHPEESQDKENVQMAQSLAQLERVSRGSEMMGPSGRSERSFRATQTAKFIDPAQKSHSNSTLPFRVNGTKRKATGKAQETSRKKVKTGHYEQVRPHMDAEKDTIQLINRMDSAIRASGLATVNLPSWFDSVTKHLNTMRAILEHES